MCRHQCIGQKQGERTAEVECFIAVSRIFYLGGEIFYFRHTSSTCLERNSVCLVFLW